MVDCGIFDSASARGRPFVKLHGLGNDFVVVDGRHQPLSPSPRTVMQVCDRHIGIGGDQLLVIEQPASPQSTIRLRIYNIDGVEAQSCFNAVRCVAWLLMEEKAADTIIVETLGGLIEATRAGDRRVSLRIDDIRYEWQSIPLAGPLSQAGAALENGPLRNPFAVNPGNPHLVYFVPDLGALDAAALADPIQKSRYLPQQANIDIAEILSDGHIRLVVYERPGILTQACGSGACATVLAAHRKGLMQGMQAKVDMPGGSLDIRIIGENSVLLTGDVAISFYGISAWELA
ncbi:diaminopimelate epimerase [Falsochrobactrum shanghaiense]|uniref:Diaminopimelate epimerase n=1 Tax=Falsochrobactrum shanghaiense TaxID=2201899 RepID=A0A316J7L0_9HYPH|nr:diaminopimelate epimerase [Falsochrobactrum shanghaiense]PWL16769.1 diaminopimelate epimerase [Falsochrobactrum shanghaiense]